MDFFISHCRLPQTNRLIRCLFNSNSVTSCRIYWTLTIRASCLGFPQSEAVMKGWEWPHNVSIWYGCGYLIFVHLCSMQFPPGWRISNLFSSGWAPSSTFKTSLLDGKWLIRSRLIRLMEWEWEWKLKWNQKMGINYFQSILSDILSEWTILEIIWLIIIIFMKKNHALVSPANSHVSAQ